MTALTDDERGTVDLSIVIPSYDSAPYLPSTLAACAAALEPIGWSAEVIVVDDGSSDGTAALVESLAPSFPFPLSVVVQPNSGRFLARWAGLAIAAGHTVLLLDSRVLLGPGSLRHIELAVAAEPRRAVWNGHAITDPAAPLVGHFWEVPVHVFWGDFLGRPRPVEFGLEDFNRYPKGTGVFLAPREVLVEACRAAWPHGDAALASDDTKLIRFIAAEHPVQLDPAFWAVYRPRTNVRSFIRHSVGRGTFLVDSFGGTSTAWNAALIGLAVAPVVGLAAVVALAVAGAWPWIAALAGAAVLAAGVPAVLAARGGCPRRGLLAYVVFLPVFVLPYWAGLLRGLRVHGGNLRRGSSTPTPVATGDEAR
ncbi:glycosyltransferase family A protein [Cellulomonas sp. KRMCY2]|uniref:glycosyltransferase family A protein n=1 Tax=Cellulomonas sp. KRMCY2 TaxID=1304865 RepID=UPI0004AFCF91|nr:glycosyltransferase family A protein [Cellulomonas sp. KRMCY2]